MDPERGSQRHSREKGEFSISDSWHPECEQLERALAQSIDFSRRAHRAPGEWLSSTAREDSVDLEEDRRL
jgi:hypothetical protein